MEWEYCRPSSIIRLSPWWKRALGRLGPPQKKHGLENAWKKFSVFNPKSFPLPAKLNFQGPFITEIILESGLHLLAIYRWSCSVCNNCIGGCWYWNLHTCRSQGLHTYWSLATGSVGELHWHQYCTLCCLPSRTLLHQDEWLEHQRWCTQLHSNHRQLTSIVNSQPVSGRGFIKFEFRPVSASLPPPIPSWLALLPPVL